MGGCVNGHPFIHPFTRSLIYPSRSGAMILGIDIGGTKCAAALGTAAGEIAARSEIETRAAEGPQAILERLIATARELLAREGLRAAELEGVGISCGGP